VKISSREKFGEKGKRPITGRKLARSTVRRNTSFNNVLRLCIENENSHYSYFRVYLSFVALVDTVIPPN